MIQPRAIRGPESEGLVSTTLLQRTVDQINQSFGLNEPPTNAPAFAGIALLKIVSNCAGGGKYKAKIFDTNKSDGFSESGNLSESMIGTVTAATFDAYAMNLEEVGASSHVLTEGSNTPLALGVFVRFKVSGTTAYPVFAVLSILSEDCP